MMIKYKFNVCEKVSCQDQRAAKILHKGEMFMMGLLGQPYRVKKEIEKELRDYGTKNNIAIPNTLDLKEMPPELGLEACIDSQNRKKNRRIVR